MEAFRLIVSWGCLYNGAAYRGFAGRWSQECLHWSNCLVNQRCGALVCQTKQCNSYDIHVLYIILLLFVFITVMCNSFVIVMIYAFICATYITMWFGIVLILK